MKLDEGECRARFAAGRVARLATVGTAGPRLVPVTFALFGDVVVTAVDAKPKSTTRLARLDDIRHDPRVSLLVDDYTEDWTQLWWVRADGTASIEPVSHETIGRLAARYPQYETEPPRGPVIRIAIDRWLGWAAS